MRRTFLKTLTAIGLLLLAVGGRVSSQVIQTPPTIYLRSDSLFVDVIVDSLFGRHAQDAIDSGMSTSITHQLRLSADGQPDVVRSVIIQLHNDIWENRYTLIWSARGDTLSTQAFTEVERTVSTLSRLPIGVLDRSERPYRLAIRSGIDLISPEQERRTRRWLNLLERGSVLELFFSLDPREQDVPWSEVARFSRGDLPQAPPYPPSQNPAPAEAPEPGAQPAVAPSRQSPEQSP